MSTAQENAREGLFVQLTRVAQTAYDGNIPSLARWRLEQARSLVKPDETNHRILKRLGQIAKLEHALSGAGK